MIMSRMIRHLKHSYLALTFLTIWSLSLVFFPAEQLVLLRDNVPNLPGLFYLVGLMVSEWITILLSYSILGAFYSFFIRPLKEELEGLGSWLLGTLSVVSFTIGLRALSIDRAESNPAYAYWFASIFGSILGYWAMGVVRKGFWAVLIRSTLMLSLAGALSITSLVVLMSANPLTDRVIPVQPLLKLKPFYDNLQLEDQHRSLSINNENLTLLLGYLSSFTGDIYYQGRFSPKGVELHLSLPVLGPKQDAFLNIHFFGLASVDAGNFSIHLKTFKVGSIEFPTEGLSKVTNEAIRIYQSSSKGHRSKETLESIQFDRKGVHIRVKRTEDEEDDTGSLYSKIFVSRELSESIQSQIEGLLNHYAQQNDKATFLSTLKAAFGRAQERTLDGLNPILQNRAAIIALSTLSGHPDLADRVGIDKAIFQNHPSYRRFMQTTLRGRRDWAQHYLISAALELLAIPRMSHSIGLLKEEIDADGGSGFSFADLAADLSGIRFAQQATRSGFEAIKFQRKVAILSHISHIAPSMKHLPEGILEASFKDRFVSIDSDRFNQMIDTIERSIEKCSLLSQTHQTTRQ